MFCARTMCIGSSKTPTRHMLARHEPPPRSCCASTMASVSPAAASQAIVTADREFVLLNRRGHNEFHVARRANDRWRIEFAPWHLAPP